jgi:ribosomal protein L37E
MALFPKRKEICPNCGWDMKLKTGVLVSSQSLNVGLAALGALGFGAAGAIVGAAMGSEKKRTMYVCQNIRCGAIYEPFEFMAWKEEAERRGELNQQ